MLGFSVMYSIFRVIIATN